MKVNPRPVNYNGSSSEHLMNTSCILDIELRALHMLAWVVWHKWIRSLEEDGTDLALGSVLYQLCNARQVTSRRC